MTPAEQARQALEAWCKEWAESQYEEWPLSSNQIDELAARLTPVYERAQWAEQTSAAQSRADIAEERTERAEADVARLRKPASILQAALDLVKIEYPWCLAEGGFERDQNLAAQKELEKLLRAALAATEPKR
jgi:hypothetical protein